MADTGQRLYIEKCGNGFIFETLTWDVEKDTWRSGERRWVSQDIDVTLQYVREFCEAQRV